MDLGFLGGRNGPLEMVDEGEMSHAFLFPRLVSEDAVESGGLSSPDPEDCVCVAMNEKKAHQNFSTPLRWEEELTVEHPNEV